MVPSTLFVLAAILSSFTVGNGAIIQRQATSSFLTPQPTVPGTGNSTAPSTTPTTSTVTGSSSPTTSPTTSPSAATTPATSPTSSLPPTSSGTLVPPPSCSLPVTPTSSGVVIPTKTSTPTTTAATPTSSAGGANCNGIQQWQSAFAYVAGNQVIYNGQLYTATQWTYNNAPAAHPDQWAFGGACAQPVNNKANCSGVPGWQSNVAYTAGDQATFNNHLYAAVQWTQANAPGGTSGTWKDLGVCA